MQNEPANGPRRIIGPTGEPLTLDMLPPPDIKRWVIRRKAEVVAAIRGDLLSIEQACVRYNLSEEEIATWQLLVEAHGLPGLRTTRVNQYRHGGEGRRSDAPFGCKTFSE